MPIAVYDFWGGGGGGRWPTEHNRYRGRDAEDAHPMSAIESLPYHLAPSGLLSALRRARACAPAAQATAVRSAFGANLNGAGKWTGGVLAPNGRIYGIAFGSNNFLVIDPATNSATRTNFGLGGLSGGDKWCGGVLAPDGRIFGIPWTDANILIINPTANTAARTTLGLNLTGIGKWAGGVLGPDGRIFGIPYNATDILIIDPATNTATRSAMGADLSGSAKWWGGVLAPTGLIYAIPYGATDFLVIDPLGNRAWRTPLGLSMPSGPKWSGGVLGPDGRIYGMPSYSNAGPGQGILIINPFVEPLGAAGQSTMGTTILGGNMYQGGVLGPDGLIYGIPFTDSAILVIDPLRGVAWRTTLGLPTFESVPKWSGGVLAQDGRIFAIPQNSTDILAITPRAAPFPPSIPLSPYCNKF